MTVLEIGGWIAQTGLSMLAAFVGFLLVLPTKIGEKVVGDVFERRLLGLRDSQNRKIEELKEQLSHLGDRGKRSNEMEFLAIRAVWEAFVEAWLSTNTAVIASMEVPDFSSLSNEDIDALLTSSDFSEDQKRTLIGSTDKHRAYVRIVTWKYIVRSGNDINSARLLLRKQRIFMPKEMREQFDKGIESMTMAFVGKKLEFQDPKNFNSQFTIKYLENHMDLFENVANAANSRLFREENKRH